MLPDKLVVKLGPQFLAYGCVDWLAGVGHCSLDFESCPCSDLDLLLVLVSLLGFLVLNEKETLEPGEMTGWLRAPVALQRTTFVCQHPCDGPQPFVTPVPGDTPPSSGLLRHCMHALY